MATELTEPTLIGLTVFDQNPVGRQHIRTEPGVTAIYGKNGVGKSRLLQSLAGMLEHRSERYDDADGRSAILPDRSTAPHPAVAMYSSGYHVLIQRSADVALSFWSTVDMEERDLFSEEPPPTADDEVRHIGGLLPSGAPADAAEYLADRGVFWISDGGALAYICDPDPSGGPLAELWSESQEEWRNNLRQATEEDLWLDEADGSASQYLTFPNRWRFGLRVRGRAIAPPKLALLPATIGIDDWPAWAAAPVAFTGQFWPGERLGTFGEKESDLIAETVHCLPYGFEWSPPRTAAEARRAPQKSTIESAERLQQSAQDLLNKLFDEPPLLDLTVTHPSVWFAGGDAVDWSASSDHARPNVQLNHLGSAHARYSKFAIQRALHVTQESSRGNDAMAAETPGKFILIVDEPERALHPAAEATVAKGLASLAEIVIVATHSTEIIDQADHLIHAVEDGATVRLAPLVFDLSPSERRSTASRLGLPPSRLAALTKVLVFVEGQQDKAVIEEFLFDELKQARAEVVPMGGTYGINSIAAAGYITAATDAPIVICLDNASNTQFQGLYERLKAAQSKGDGDRVLNNTRNQKAWSSSDEAKRLHGVMTTAWNANQFKRIRPFAFSKRDISNYLDPKDLGLQFEDWESAWSAYTKTERAGEGIYTGERFKDWCRRSKGAAFYADGLRSLAARYAIAWRTRGDAATNRPQDFNDLADLIIRATKEPRTW